MGELIIENLVAAIALAILSYFISKAGKKWKIAIIIMALIVFGFSMYSSIKKRSTEIAVRRDSQDAKEKLNKIMHEDSLLNINYQQLYKNYNDLYGALKKANLKYDSKTNSIIKTTIHNYGIIPRQISEQEVIDCITATFNGQKIDKTVEVYLIAEGALSENPELNSVKKQIISILEKNGFLNVVKRLHFEDLNKTAEKIYCVLNLKEHNLMIKIPPFPTE